MYTTSRSGFDSALSDFYISNKAFEYEAKWIYDYEPVDDLPDYLRWGAEAVSRYRNYTVNFKSLVDGWKIRNGKSIEYTKDPKVLDNIDEEDAKNIDSFLGEFNMIGGDKCE